MGRPHGKNLKAVTQLLDLIPEASPSTKAFLLDNIKDLAVIADEFKNMDAARPTTLRGLDIENGRKDHLNDSARISRTKIREIILAAQVKPEMDWATIRDAAVEECRSAPKQFHELRSDLSHQIQQALVR